jgi:hypothetical protein
MRFSHITYLNTTESVRSKEIFTFGCDVIPLPLEEVDHGRTTRSIVWVSVCQGHGQARQKKYEANHPREKKMDQSSLRA